MTALIRIIAFAVLLFAAPCYAENLYVRPVNDCTGAPCGSANGSDWDNAFNGFAAVSWGDGAGKVSAGDTLYIDGGAVSATYNERFVTGADGSAGNLITIQVGQDAGHNGTAIIDGMSGTLQGIVIQNSFIKFTGQVGTGTDCKIKTQNNNYSGVDISGAITNFEVAYVESTLNNRVKGACAGIYVHPTESNTLNSSVHHCKIHNQVYGDDLWVAMVYASVVDGYGKLNIYNNDIYDFHADAVKLLGEGISFYNNTVRDRGTYISDHPDGMQVYGGYTKIYNNTFSGFHRTDDNNVNSYIRYNPDGATGHNANPQYFWIYNNLFYETLPLSFVAASKVTAGGETYTCTVGHYSDGRKQAGLNSVVTHGGITYTCKIGHISTSGNAAYSEPGVGSIWSTYWDQTGTGGDAWALDTTYSAWGTHWSKTGTGGDPWALDTPYSQVENVRRGIELSFSDPTFASINHLYVFNNTMVGTNYFGLTLPFRVGIATANVADVIIANNLFYDGGMATGNYGSGIIMSFANGDGTITYGKWGDSVDIIVDYNTVFASSASWVTSQSYLGTVYSWADFKTTSGTSAAPATATTDPSLDASYKPQVTSPYKQAGVDLSSYFTTDAEGTSRTLWSIGAYEYGGGATTYTVTSSVSSGSGTISFEGADVIADGGDSRTYTATPANGWKVTWSGTCGATGSAATYQKTGVDADCTVIATFTEIKLMPW